MEIPLQQNPKKALRSLIRANKTNLVEGPYSTPLVVTVRTDRNKRNNFPVITKTWYINKMEEEDVYEYFVPGRIDWEKIKQFYEIPKKSNNNKNPQKGAK